MGNGSLPFIKRFSRFPCSPRQSLCLCFSLDNYALLKFPDSYAQRLSLTRGNEKGISSKSLKTDRVQ